MLKKHNSVHFNIEKDFFYTPGWSIRFKLYFNDLIYSEYLKHHEGLPSILLSPVSNH